MKYFEKALEQCVKLWKHNPEYVQRVIVARHYVFIDGKRCANYTEFETRIIQLVKEIEEGVK